jgi:hypothetical protein
MNEFVRFLETLGFSDVRPLKSDGVELFVRDALKSARKKMRARNIQFRIVSQHTTNNSTITEYCAIEKRKVLGNVHMTSYSTHSIIKLTSIEREEHA